MQAKGAPLSVWIACGSPYCSNHRSNCCRTAAVRVVAMVAFVGGVVAAALECAALVWLRQQGAIAPCAIDFTIDYLRPAVSRDAERWANPLMGALSGAVAGITGVADSGDTSSWYRGELQDTMAAMIAGPLPA